jgi:hypothetical protein
MKQVLCVIPLLAWALAVPGCGDDGGGPAPDGTPGPLSQVTVTPASTTVFVGAERAFTASGKDLDGRPVEIDPTWSVSPSHLGRVTVEGVFTANCLVDTGFVKATVGGKVSGRADVALVGSSGGEPATLEIDPDTISVRVGGDFVQLYIVAKDATGIPVAVEPTWDVSPRDLGQVVNAQGLFMSGETVGVGEITAVSGSVVARAVVRVVSRPS